MIDGTETRMDWLKGILAAILIPAAFLVAGCGESAKPDISTRDNTAHNSMRFAVSACEAHDGPKLVYGEDDYDTVAVLCADGLIFSAEME